MNNSRILRTKAFILVDSNSFVLEGLFVRFRETPTLLYIKWTK
jgi:hypothetical protein